MRENKKSLALVVDARLAFLVAGTAAHQVGGVDHLAACEPTRDYSLTICIDLRTFGAVRILGFKRERRATGSSGFRLKIVGLRHCSHGELRHKVNCYLLWRFHRRCDAIRRGFLDNANQTRLEKQAPMRSYLLAVEGLAVGGLKAAQKDKKKKNRTTVPMSNEMLQVVQRKQALSQREQNTCGMMSLVINSRFAVCARGARSHHLLRICEQPIIA